MLDLALQDHISEYCQLYWTSENEKTATERTGSKIPLCGENQRAQLVVRPVASGVGVYSGGAGLGG
jgi:hypothetical protein